MKKTAIELIRMINEKKVTQLYVNTLPFPNNVKITKNEALDQLCTFVSTYELDVTIEKKTVVINH